MRHWLILHRRNKELTQMLVAMQAGISRAYYTQLELDQRDPSVKVAKRLGIILEFNWHWFFEDFLEINQPESIIF